MHPKPAVYGFVGAGEIASAIVRGLSADVADPPTIVLSPRGRAVGRELADRFPNVRVCRSNQDVLDSATSVVLAVRPQVAEAVVAELSFRPEHVVVSAVAGLHLRRLHELIAPATDIVRSIPLPQATRRQSLTVMYPDNAVAREIFERVGGVVVPDDEPNLDTLWAATATFAAHLDYLSTIANWLVEHGVDASVADGYLRHVFGQVGQSLLQSTSLAALSEKHTTPGGINEQLMVDLQHDGLPDALRRSLDRVLIRLRGNAE